MSTDDTALIHSWAQTAWSKVLLGRGQGDAARQARNELLLRYHEVVLRYFLARMRDKNAAHELYSNFALRLLESDALIRNADRGRGQFRHYLKQALYNMVRDWHRANARQGPASLEWEAEDAPADDSAFSQEWNQELLNQAWKALELADRAGKTYHYVVLRAHADNPELAPAQMAELLASKLGKPFAQEALRQARHRARERFGALLLAEVERTLTNPTLDQLEEELVSLKLLEYCKKALAERRQAAG